MQPRSRSSSSARSPKTSSDCFEPPGVLKWGKGGGKMEHTAESARFAARMKQDDRMYRQLIRFHHKYLTHLFLCFRIVGVVALLAFLMTLAEVLATGSGGAAFRLVEAALLGLLFLFAPEWVTALSVRSARKNRVSGMLETRMAFYGDRMAWETDQSAGEIYYSQFVKAFETREGYYLYIAKQQAYVLDRDGFTRGGSGGIPRVF
ncbi:YcxB family protein [Anaerotruncus massiliensis (ex Liu et al. 2021)]|uniref:YcxB family protein n=3 Tax=Anaerotruncus TaxID=244127 RepID=A0A498CLU7_9FIRM|nr:YcxB family protein [Anaerotruncus massiliensis (ex Liu et al. 2021)]